MMFLCFHQKIFKPCFCQNDFIKSVRLQLAAVSSIGLYGANTHFVQNTLIGTGRIFSGRYILTCCCICMFQNWNAACGMEVLTRILCRPGSVPS